MNTYSKELIDIAENVSTISVSKNKKLLDEVKLATTFLDTFKKDVPLSTRLMTIREGLDESTWPKCIVCDSPVKWNVNTPTVLSETCSDQCSKVARSVEPEKLAILKDKEKLYGMRYDEKMSIDAIAADIGVSHPTIEKWLHRIHGFTKLRYNESPRLVKSFLDDRDFLYQSHVVDRKTIREIAEEIGSSNYIVWSALARHGIETNDPNTYPRKNVSVSKECKEVSDFVIALGFNVILNDRNILDNGQEIDILVPEKNFAIEYNGLYSHVFRPYENTPSKVKGEKYHLTKTDIMESKGYQLFHIFSDVWKEKRHIVESMIRAKLGKSPLKVYARNCAIQEVEPHPARVFLNNSHLQGYAYAKRSIGLFHDGEMVALMTFTPSRYSKKVEWELVRFACRLNTNVVGGFSKLLSYFLKNEKGDIVSYADRSYSQGNVYECNGFRKDRVNPPQYHYVDWTFSTRLNRQKYMRHKIASPGDSRTEFQIMTDNGYHKIFNCGTITYILER